jgi:hypothetical protein
MFRPIKELRNKAGLVRQLPFHKNRHGPYLRAKKWIGGRSVFSVDLFELTPTFSLTAFMFAVMPSAGALVSRERD